jgi:electron transport complex protein RnfE
MSKLQNLLKGIIKENPVLVLVLGTCPTLATTTSVLNALGMGVAATVVLICSNIAISALRKVIPDKVRIPCYIVLIAGFVTIIEMLMHALVPDLYESLGVFLSLIVVNCIILGRAEMYASKNSVVDSAIDAVGMGIGFTLALFLMASIREIFGAGTFLGFAIPWLSENPILIFGMAPGGFFVFGCLIALVNKISKKKNNKEFGCHNCPSAYLCGKKDENPCATVGEGDDK